MSRIADFRQFVGEVQSELKKTTWPTRKEVYGTTVVVLIFIVICAFYLYVVDLGLSWSVNKIFEVFK